MEITYTVGISGTGQENRFGITWYNHAANSEERFESGFDIEKINAGTLDQKPAQALETGHKLFEFLNGEKGHLQKALQEASNSSRPLILNLATNNDTHDWPFELLAYENTHLLPQHPPKCHLIRKVARTGEANPIEPQNRPLTLLFMASSPLDVHPVLDFEKEEETLFKVTEKLSMDLEVEDSGSLEGIRERVLDKKYDVVHISGHADIKEGKPYFILEDETGQRRDAAPHQLWKEALMDNPPVLLFLSGCRTAEAAA